MPTKAKSPTKRTITAKRAVAIAIQWYNGDRSALYKLASHTNGNCSTLSSQDIADAYTEATHECTRCIYAKRPADRKALHALCIYLIHASRHDDGQMSTAILNSCQYDDGYRAAMHDARINPSILDN